MAEDKQPFEVHSYTISELKSLLANRKTTTLGIIDKKAHSAYLDDYLKELCAKTILVENNYIDRDFLEDYSGYYVRCFQPYISRCTRLHFFNLDFSDKDFENLLKKDESPLSKDILDLAYLGFIIVKPLPQTTIGRTCLKTYTTGTTQRFFPVTRKYKVHLFGINLKIESLAFQEQDSVVAACATSALWSVFHRTGTLFHHAIPSPLEITKSAASNVPMSTRILPNTDGLNFYQMANAIRSVRLEPFVINVEDEYVLKNTLYTYLHATIPMILSVSLFEVAKKGNRLVANKLIGKHAVAITGYNLGLEKPVPYGATGFLNKASRINKIYVHDDQIGPFARMIFDNRQVSLSDHNNDFIEYDSLGTSWSKGKARAIPKDVLIPLYHKIRISLYVIHREVIIFDSFFETLRGQGFFPHLLQRQEWDISLISLHNLKKKLFDSTELDGEYLKNILIENMPRFLWRATATYDNNKIIDLLFDATDIEQGPHFVMAIEYDNGSSIILRAAFKNNPVGTFPEIRGIHDWYNHKSF